MAARSGAMCSPARRSLAVGNKAKLAGTKEVSVQDAIEKLTFLASPHIESFDYWIDEGLQRSVDDLDPVEITTEDGRSITCAYSASCCAPSGAYS